MKLKKKTLKKVLAYVAVIGIGIIFFMPFLWLILCSLKSEAELFQMPPTFLPKTLVFENYKDAVTQIPYLRYTANTLLISLAAICGTVLSCSLVAYSISKVQWAGKNLVFILIIGTMMLPAQVTLIPVYMIWNRLGFIDTYVPLLLPHFCAPPLYVFMVRQFYMTIPDSLLDSARLDGAGDFMIWSRIMLPLSKSILGVAALLTFINTWSDFLGPLLYINSMEKRTLSIGLTMFVSEHAVEWGPLMAAAALFSLIIVIPFLIFNKQLIGSIKLSGFK